MANETIELAKNWNAEKMKFPAVFQQKMDGMPVRFMKTKDKVIGVSRQGEPVVSCQHICLHLEDRLKPGESVIMEVLVPDLPFKTSTGLIRQTKKQVPEAIGYIFDGSCGLNSYYNRLVYFLTWCLGPSVLVMPGQKIVYSTEQAEKLAQELPKDAEGACVHWIDKPFEPGKRNWMFQRIKPQPTIDLKLHSYEEAIDQYGEPKGMVGRINVEYRNKVIGIGPGNMTHNERMNEWQSHEDRVQLDRIIEVKYMPDDTYDALRQPTFVRLRPDKETADA